MKKFLNAFDYDPQLIEHEVNEEPSQTVPEMTMSLRQILERYTRGGEVATLQPVYQDHDDFDENPEIAKMDTMERMQYAANLREAIANHQNKPKAEKPKEAPPKEEPPKTPEAKPEEPQQ